MEIEKIYQMFILGTGNLEKSLAKGLGGVIFFSKDIDSESILANIKKEQSCPDMNISCIGEINHEFIYQCDCCPQDIGEVTLVCEGQ